MNADNKIINGKNKFGMLCAVFIALAGVFLPGPATADWLEACNFPNYRKGWYGCWFGTCKKFSGCVKTLCESGGYPLSLDNVDILQNNSRQCTDCADQSFQGHNGCWEWKCKGSAIRHPTQTRCIQPSECKSVSEYDVPAAGTSYCSSSNWASDWYKNNYNPSIHEKATNAAGKDYFICAAGRCNSGSASSPSCQVVDFDKLGGRGVTGADRTCKTCQSKEYVTRTEVKIGVNTYTVGSCVPLGTANKEQMKKCWACDEPANFVKCVSGDASAAVMAACPSRDDAVDTTTTTSTTGGG